MIGFFLAAALSLLPLNETSYSQLIAKHRGAVVLLDFWATWCSPCREELPQIVSLQKRLGFQLVTVSVDEPEQRLQASKLLQQVGVAGLAYLKQTDSDERFIAAVDAKWSGAVPALFLYDRSGRLVKSFVGETDLKIVEAAIRKL